MEQNTQSSENNTEIKLDGEGEPIISRSENKSSKKNILLIIIVLIAVSLIAVFFLVLKKDDSKQLGSEASVEVVKDEEIIEVEIDKNLDSDQDKLPDYLERIIGTDEKKSDTDGDSYDDFEEIKNGYNPLNDKKYTEEEWGEVKKEIKSEDEGLFGEMFELDILTIAKDKIKEIKTVRAVKKAEKFMSINGREMHEEEYNMSDSTFIFPNKKKILLSALWTGIDDKNDGIIVIGNDIYMKFSLLDELSQESVEIPQWFYGKSGQEMTSFIPDDPGGKISFDIKNYDNSWEFTKMIEEIENELDVENVNGNQCRNYSVKLKKIPLILENLEMLQGNLYKEIFGSSFDDEVSTEELVFEKKGKNLSVLINSKNILIPIPELVKNTVMYMSIVDLGIKGRDNSDIEEYYIIDTRSIIGNICIGIDDDRVYKERYTIEGSHYYFKNGEGADINNNNIYNKDVYEITYSDFDKNIEIEVPQGKIITVEEINSMIKQ